MPTELLDSTYVAGVTSIADTLKDAIESSYKKVENIKFDNRYYRNDIGAKALKAGEEN